MKLLGISIIFLAITFTGQSQCKGDCKNGYGEYKWSDGDQYKGEWKEGKFHGKGAYFYSNGSTYTGTYNKGKKHGEGIFVNANGKNFEGVWENGKRVEKTNTLLKKWMLGRWEGKGYQDNGDTWHVVLEYNNKDDIRISYPDFPCNGNWYFDQENAKQIFFNEKITKGQNKCRPGTRILVEKEHDNIVGVYFFQDKKQVASANLVKQ